MAENIREIRLHDTLTRQVRPLVAEDGKRYRFYCCGPTVYGPAHIGNFRTFLVQDVLRRMLEAAGLNPCHVRNITDVDDKTIRGSMQAGKSLEEFTRGWTERFHADCTTLNALPPHVEPTATGHIAEQIAIIQRLIQKGRAYASPDGSVYFKVSAFPEYGRLSRVNERELATQSTNSAGAVNDADEYERDSVRDFALWKAHKPEDGPNSWPSPWGPGRPGWHIECSAMSMRYLGETFDLHGGGVDLCFPHHENEIAQSEGATGKPFCRHWFHSAHLMVEGQKMSKSLGNLYTLKDLADKGFGPMAVRYTLISGHYRAPLNFTINGLKAAESALRKLEKEARVLLKAAGLADADFERFCACPAGDLRPGRFAPAWDALRDDLNTAGALGQVFVALAATPADTTREQALEDLAGLGLICYALGLKLFTETPAATTEAPAEVKALAEARWQAKQSKNWAEADRLRDALATQGWKALDRKDGYSLEKI